MVNRTKGIREEKKNCEASGPYFWHCGRRPTGLGLADLIGGGLQARLLKKRERSRRHSEALLMYWVVRYADERLHTSHRASEDEVYNLINENGMDWRALGCAFAEQMSPCWWLDRP